MVSESTAAAPDASANATESKPSSVRDKNSALKVSVGYTNPIPIDMTIAIAIPTNVLNVDFSINATSPSTVPKPNAKFGSNNGAIIITPINYCYIVFNQPHSSYNSR